MYGNTVSCSNHCWAKNEIKQLRGGLYRIRAVFRVVWCFGHMCIYLLGALFVYFVLVDAVELAMFCRRLVLFYVEVESKSYSC